MHKQPGSEVGMTSVHMYASKASTFAAHPTGGVDERILLGAIDMLGGDVSKCANATWLLYWPATTDNLSSPTTIISVMIFGPWTTTLCVLQVNCFDDK